MFISTLQDWMFVTQLSMNISGWCKRCSCEKVYETWREIPASRPYGQPTTAKKGMCTYCSGPRTFQEQHRRLPEGVSSTAKKGPLPWEGARASKSDGKPGKGTLGRHDSRRTPRGGAKTSGDPAPKVRLTKRPAVLARKQGALYKAGKGPAPPKIAGANRRSDKGKGGGKPKKAK
jgi:hypothetical protein